MAWPSTFETARLRAERLREDHLPELSRMHRDVRVMEHLGGVFSDDQTRAYLERNLAHWNAHQHGVWILHGRDVAEPIGRAVLRHLTVDDVDEVETGYAFYEPYWGRGYATEATRACLALGFGELRLSSIVAVTTPTNTRSQRVLLKCGLRYEQDFQRDKDTLSLFRIDKA
jgi:RimJ/RimL family protein N-acetyltransferase